MPTRALNVGAAVGTATANSRNVFSAKNIVSALGTVTNTLSTATSGIIGSILGSSASGSGYAVINGVKMSGGHVINNNTAGLIHANSAFSIADFMFTAAGGVFSLVNGLRAPADSGWQQARNVTTSVGLYALGKVASKAAGKAIGKVAGKAATMVATKVAAKAIGAKVGGVLGSVIPVVGTIVGAAVGVAIGVGVSYLTNWLIYDGGFKVVGNAVTSAATWVGNTAKNVANTVGNAVTGAANAVANTVVNVVKDPIGTAKQVGSAVVSGAKTAVNAVASTAKNIGKALTRW
jgi:hypothetical protein